MADDQADDVTTDEEMTDDVTTDDVTHDSAARGQAPADARRGDHFPHPAEALRGLAGGGPSKIGLNGAMRARDVSRPHATPPARST